MKASKGSKGPPPHHDQWKLSCKMLITLMDNILSERNDKTCRMKWVTCYKLPCTRCPCQSPWHFPIGKKHQLAHRVRCAKFVKTFLLLWNTSSLISAKTRVENGLLFFKSNTIEEIVHILSNFCILTIGAGWLILIDHVHSTSLVIQDGLGSLWWTV